MARRIEAHYVRGTGEVTRAFIVEGQERLLPETATYNDLKPLRLTGDEALRDLVQLPRDAPDSAIGTTGPPLASVSGAENAGNPRTAAYADRFLRDSVISTRFSKAAYPQLSAATSHFWLERVGTERNDETHEQPWRAPHRFHQEGDPGLAKLEGTDDDVTSTSFASIDATPLLVRSVLEDIRDDPRLLRRQVTHYTGAAQYSYAEAVAGQLNLIRAWRAENREGVIETEAYSGSYKSFPVWKDSPTAYVHADGMLASAPVCSVEMMGYATEVFTAASELAAMLPELGWDARELRAEASSARATLLERFWLPQAGYFALGTDRGPSGELRALQVKASNMGYLFPALSGDEFREFREAIVRRLFTPEMACPAGFLTMANDEVMFGENRYHNGPPWLHDTFDIALKMAPHYPALAGLICQVILRNCREFRPEFLPATDNPNPEPNRWDVRVERRNVYGDVIRPTVEKSPQPLQGWAETARIGAVSLLQELKVSGMRAANVQDRRVERDLLPQARELLALPLARAVPAMEGAGLRRAYVQASVQRGRTTPST